MAAAAEAEAAAAADDEAAAADLLARTLARDLEAAAFEEEALARAAALVTE